MASWRLLGIFWAAVMAAKTALEALLGSSCSWGGLGGSWASLGRLFGFFFRAWHAPSQAANYE